MKYITFIFLGIILINYSQCSASNEHQNTNKLNRLLGKKLIDNGFLKYADSVTMDSLKKQIIDSFHIYEDGIYKLVFIDAEELSEFNFDFFMPRLNRILSKRGIQIKIETAPDYEVSHDIFLNGRKIKLYTEKEVESYKFWDSASRNFFKKVNEILKDNNIEERFYLLYGGNDLHVFLLTDKQFEIIAEKYKNEKNEIPYLP